MREISKKQYGLTLVELLIAMMIGLFIVGAVIQVYLANRSTSRLQDALSVMQENGRIAMESIARDLRNADYWGCLESDKIQNHIAPTLNVPVISTSADGEDDAPETLVNPHYVNIEKGLDGEEGTSDALVIRGAQLLVGLKVMPLSNPEDDIKLSGDATTLARLKQRVINSAHRSLMIADCKNADVFTVDSTSSAIQLKRKTQENSKDPIPCATGKHCLSAVYQDNASIYKPFTLRYFVRDNALYRQYNNDVAMPIADQVENIQLLYGEDRDADGQADRYSTVTNVTNADNVVSMKISLLFRSQESVSGAGKQHYWFDWEQKFAEDVTKTDEALKQEANDGRMRKQFSATIALRNRLG